MRSIYPSILAGLALVLSACNTAPTAAQTAPAKPNAFPGIGLSLDQLKSQYQHTYMAKRLKPKKWPNGFASRWR
ncbi:MAG TPA: hypothetical protein VNU44_20830 [Bryobacteraceae bacterium]|nr:hypothetical protein [Bryobacteraceae bacterium]